MSEKTLIVEFASAMNIPTFPSKHFMQISWRTLSLLRNLWYLNCMISHPMTTLKIEIHLENYIELFRKSDLPEVCQQKPDGIWINSIGFNHHDRVSDENGQHILLDVCGHHQARETFPFNHSFNLCMQWKPSIQLLFLMINPIEILIQFALASTPKPIPHISLLFLEPSGALNFTFWR